MIKWYGNINIPYYPPLVYWEKRVVYFQLQYLVAVSFLFLLMRGSVVSHDYLVQTGHTVDWQSE